MKNEEMSAGRKAQLHEEAVAADRVVKFCRLKADRLREDLHAAEKELVGAEDKSREAHRAAEASTAPRYLGLVGS